MSKSEVLALNSAWLPQIRNSIKGSVLSFHWLNVQDAADPYKLNHLLRRSKSFQSLNIISVSSSRVPAAHQMVPGPAAFRPTHPGTDLRPPLDEGDGRVAQVPGGASCR